MARSPRGKVILVNLLRGPQRRRLSWSAYNAAGARLAGRRWPHNRAVIRHVRRNNAVGAAHISARAVRTIIPKRAANAGVEGSISAHSLRVGAAQSLAAAGLSVVEMQLTGRWVSVTMPGSYASGQLAARGAAAKLRYRRA